MLFTFLVPGFFLACHCQPYEIVDTFDDNRMNWWLGESNGGSQQLVDGKLVMKLPEGGWTTVISPFLEFQRDFEFKVSLRQLNGASNVGIGVVWGYDDATERDYNCFQISSQGFYYISNTAMEQALKQTPVGNWTSTPHVKPSGQVNIIEVKQSGDNLSFFINGQAVRSMPYFRWRGSEIGIIGSGAMTLEVDDLRFAQPGLTIILPDGLKRGSVRENLGANVNSPADELMPRISADGKSLYFERRHEVISSEGAREGEDYLSSTFDGQAWSLAAELGSPINGNVLSVSTDKNSFVFASQGKFFVRNRTATGWTDPVEMGINYSNRSAYFEACLSPNGKVMFITCSNKENLYYRAKVTERDIFVSVKDSAGKWCKPFNIGADINTARNEVGPFLAADGITLYFASDGRPGYGNMDLFMSRRLDDTWIKWSTPVNMGPDLNTIGFEAHAVVPASGEFAYLVSNTGGFGRSDIIRIALPPELRPQPIVLVIGRVLDFKSKEPVHARITINNQGTNAALGQALSNPANGEFNLVLPYGNGYDIFASASGYIPVSTNLTLDEPGHYKELFADLYLAPIESGVTIPLNNVYFEQGMARLTRKSFPELNRLVAILNEYPSMEIQLEGHTDNRGPDLVKLSKNRVKTVKRYLVNQGISKNRILEVGYGPTRPRVPNDSEENRAMNRRVEMQVLRK